MGNSSNQPISKERSLQLSTVWSCVKVISETIASLPISLYEKDADNKRYI
jgi:phage portal protein BeeE